MPNQWKKYSGIWTQTQQAQARAAETWTGLPFAKNVWYIGGYNSSGESGLSEPTATSRSSPVQISSQNGWSFLGVDGKNSVLGVKSGALFTWGLNGKGQLGHDDIISRSSPVQVGALTNWSKTACSSNVSAAIKTDGTLWTWGDNFRGGLGTNDSVLVERSSPVQVGTDTNWSKIYGSSDCFLAIKTDGTLYAWGDNGNGNLGDNSVINRSSPVQVGALTIWNEVSAANAIIATQTNGTIWFWGFGFEGGSGTNTSVNLYRSSPIQIGALTTWNKPATANDYSNGAIKNDGTLWTWGRNNGGALGLNIDPAFNRSSPVQVGSETNWTQATIGGDISSGIAGGELYTWGTNSNGEGGQNDRIQYSSPVQVGTATDWVNSFQGSNDVFAITEGKTTT